MMCEHVKKKKKDFVNNFRESSTPPSQLIESDSPSEAGRSDL